MSKLEITKLYSDNPFIDSLLYCIKKMSYGAITKSAYDADNAETPDSIKTSDQYITAIEGKGDFTLFPLNETILKKCNIPSSRIDGYLRDIFSIPEKYREKIVVEQRKFVVENYNEQNNYYRMIAGLPNYGEYGIPLKPYLYLLPKGEEVNVTYVHELGADGAKMLQHYGILDIIKNDYPKAKYLNYITAGISIYKARKCIDKQILYLPDTGNPDIEEQYRYYYEISRDYTLHNVDSAAMQYGSQNYQEFLQTYIFLITALDMLTEVQEHIIRKDILDARCVEYIFSIYGIPYFKDIPLKYQIIMCKNVNMLVQYKSSPKDMFNFLNIFGADDIQVSKYFLLRNRKRDDYGNYIYNKTTTGHSVQNRIIFHQHYDRDITDLTVPYPFEYILEKGNVVYVWADDKLLVKDKDYMIYNYDHIKFLNDVIPKTAKKINYEFYYDITTKDDRFVPDKVDSLFLTQQTFTNTTKYKYTFNLELPYGNYLIDGNQVVVSIGSTFVPPHAYTIDPDNNTITIDDSYSTFNKFITFIYLNGKKIKTYYQTQNLRSFDGNVFIMNPPFSNYIENNNMFFATYGSTFIDPARYVVNEDVFTFTDGTVIDEDRELTIHYIYSDTSIFNPIKLMHKSEIITATKHYQYQFKFNAPKEYIESGFKIFVKIRGWYLTSSFYDIYGDNLVLRDRAISLQPGESLEIDYIYGGISSNLVVYTTYAPVIKEGQTTYDIELPIDKFFSKGGQIIVDAAGYPLTEKDYTHAPSKTDTMYETITITNKDLIPFKGDKVNVQCLYYPESINSISSSYQTMTAYNDDQQEYYLNFPFYPYLETGHGIIVMHNSVIVDSRAYYIEKYKLILYPNTLKIKAGDTINVFYIYNNKYKYLRSTVLTIRQITVPTTEVDSDDIMDIPVPFEDYFENGWCYFLDSERNRITKPYDILNNGLSFMHLPDMQTYKSIRFTFIYKDSEPWLTKETTEDYGKDIDLQFIKVPLRALTNTESYIKKFNNAKTYDSVTLADKFWDGEDNVDNAHEVIREEILKQKFNYARTKYMSVDYLVDVAEYGFEIPYFYNILYDDVLKEKNLTIKIPTISTYHEFNLAYVFCYMTALAYYFRGIQDTIMTEPTHIMFCEGFNFKTSLQSIKQWILDQRYQLKDFAEIDNFVQEINQLPDIKSLMDMFKANKLVREHILHAMANADDHDIYNIWKHIYDSLMIWKFNLDFFKLKNGKVAPTFTEFLKEKDNVLYMSLMNIESIADADTKSEAIVQMIQDIVYILEEFIDTKEFKYIFSDYPGVSKEYLLEYLFTMINFFKSYKVVLDNMAIDMKFNNSDQNYVKPVGIMNFLIHYPLADYVSARSTIEFQNSYIMEDHPLEDIREKYTFFIRYEDEPYVPGVYDGKVKPVPMLEIVSTVTTELEVPDLPYISGSVTPAKQINFYTKGNIIVSVPVPDIPNVNGSITIPAQSNSYIDGTVNVVEYIIENPHSITQDTGTTGVNGLNIPSKKEVMQMNHQQLSKYLINYIHTKDNKQNIIKPFRWCIPLPSITNDGANGNTCFFYYYPTDIEIKHCLIGDFDCDYVKQFDPTVEYLKVD